MLLEKYTVIWDAEKEFYEFVSKGPRGSFRKVVQYQHLGAHIFNLAFGDWDEEEQSIDDAVRTNNADSNKVLATVASTALDFLHKNPDAELFIQGSTPARTRLYQLGIAKNRNEIHSLVTVFGIIGGKAELFTSHKNYEAFIVQARRLV